MNRTNETLYILIMWPESQNFMDAPGAFLVENPDIAGASAYMVPLATYNDYVIDSDTGSVTENTKKREEQLAGTPVKVCQPF